MRLFALLVVGLLFGSPASPAAPTEYEVKAVFLFNFSQFVDWPADAFPNAQAPLIIGVIGHDPFGAALDEAVRGEVVHGRRLEIRRYQDVEELNACHILFINPSTQEGIEQILSKLRSRSVLTVADSANFARAGGMVRFVTIDNRIRLQINLDAVKLANLEISSKLLRPAEIVSSRED